MKQQYWLAVYTLTLGAIISVKADMASGRVNGGSVWNTDFKVDGNLCSFPSTSIILLVDEG